MNQPEFTIGNLTATADMTGKNYTFVKLGAAGKFAANGANEDGIGVLQDEPLANQPGNIMHLGITLVRSGAAFALGAKLKSDAAGKAIAGTGSAQIVRAVALEAATAANQLIPVLLIGTGRSETLA